jgi:hypothetical protein
MELKTVKNNSELTVHVSMPLRGPKQPKMQLTTEDVIAELEKDGFEIARVVKPVKLLNISDARRQGVAVFELKIEKKKPSKKKTKKTIDEHIQSMPELRQQKIEHRTEELLQELKDQKEREED